MNNKFLLAQSVHDVIHDKIINIEISCNKLYYGKTKIDEIIKDVDSYLNYLKIEEIYSLILGENIDDFENCSDVINFLIKGFNTKFIDVKCFVPKKYNFQINQEENHRKKSFNQFIAIVVITIIAVTALVILNIN